MGKSKKKEMKVKQAREKNESTKPATEPVVTTLAPVQLSGVTKADRIEQNGVRRPKDGGKCAEVWQALDAMRAGGIDPSTKDVRELSTAKGWNVNNAMAELSGWRKFNGIARSVLKGSAKAALPATGAEQPVA